MDTKRPIEMQMNQAVCEVEVANKALQDCKDRYAKLLDKNLKLRMSNNEMSAELRKRDVLLDDASEMMISQNLENNRLMSLLHSAKNNEGKSFLRKLFGL